MRDDRMIAAPLPGYRVVILTLDSHAAGPCARASERLARDFPGLSLSVHAAAEWGESPDALIAAKKAIETGDIVISNLLFLEEHINAILPTLEARRDHCDAMIGVIADAQIVKLTRMGTLDMSKPASGAMKLIKKLRGTSKPSAESGESKMKMLRRLPRILKFIPGKAQDLRAWFLIMQYWLGSSDDNIEGMVRFLISRYGRVDQWRGSDAPEPLEYPDCGLYHPDLETRITTHAADLPGPAKPRATIGLLMMRSYVLSSDTAHYDAVIRAFEARGLRVIPAFAGGLDGRPAIDGYFIKNGVSQIDALVSLTGFSLVGGPAYNDNDSAVKVLSALDVPYIAAHPLEFQTLGQWAGSTGGLGPIETTMLIALPELDGATNPTVFAGRHGEDGCNGCAHRCHLFCHEFLADRTGVAKFKGKLQVIRCKVHASYVLGVHQLIKNKPAQDERRNIANGRSSVCNEFSNCFKCLNACAGKHDQIIPVLPQSLAEIQLCCRQDQTNGVTFMAQACGYTGASQCMCIVLAHHQQNAQLISG